MVTAALANSAMGVKQSSSTNKGNENVIAAVKQAGITAYAASQQKRNSGGDGGDDGGDDGGSEVVYDGHSNYGYDTDESWESYCRYKRRYEEKRKRRSRSRSRHGRSRRSRSHGRSRRESERTHSPQPREEPSQSLGSYVSD